MILTSINIHLWNFIKFLTEKSSKRIFLIVEIFSSLRIFLKRSSIDVFQQNLWFSGKTSNILIKTTKYNQNSLKNVTICWKRNSFVHNFNFSILNWRSLGFCMKPKMIRVRFCLEILINFSLSMRLKKLKYF